MFELTRREERVTPGLLPENVASYQRLAGGKRGVHPGIRGLLAKVAVHVQQRYRREHGTAGDGSQAAGERPRR